MNEINDSQGHYSVNGIDELKRFIDEAVAVRVENINNANLERLERFKLDALKNREIYKRYFDDKPNPKLFDTTDNLRVWHEKCEELEGKALKFERQHDIFKAKLESGNDDLIKRTARKDVSKQHPEKYQEYQKAKKLQTAKKLEDEWLVLESKLDQLISNDGKARDIANISTRLNAVVRRLENSEVFQTSASEKILNALQTTKSKIDIANNLGRDNGIEL